VRLPGVASREESFSKLAVIPFRPSAPVFVHSNFR
jgi:hypothetical protein